MADQRVVNAAVGRVLECVPVYVLEPLDVIGHFGSGQTQQLRGRTPARDPQSVLQPMAAPEVGVEHAREQIERALIPVVEGRPGHVRALGQRRDGDPGDRLPRGELDDRRFERVHGPGDPRVGAVGHGQASSALAKGRGGCFYTAVK